MGLICAKSHVLQIMFNSETNNKVAFIRKNVKLFTLKINLWIFGINHYL